MSTSVSVHLCSRAFPFQRFIVCHGTIVVMRSCTVGMKVVF